MSPSDLLRVLFDVYASLERPHVRTRAAGEGLFIKTFVLQILQNDKITAPHGKAVPPPLAQGRLGLRGRLPPAKGAPANSIIKRLPSVKESCCEASN